MTLHSAIHVHKFPLIGQNAQEIFLHSFSNLNMEGYLMTTISPDIEKENSLATLLHNDGMINRKGVSTMTIGQYTY